MPSIDAFRRFLLPALLAMLVAAWLGGGVTEDETAIDEWLQLLALPLLVVGAALLVAEFPQDRYRRFGLAAVAAIIAVPLLQLLPVPGSWWNLPVAREALAADLGQAGVASLRDRWTLSPHATESAVLALLPALAAFVAAMGLQASHRRRLVQALLVLVLFNVGFAFFQAGLPQGSDLRLYADFDARFGGLFANTNHQATACVIGMVLAVGLAVEARQRAERGETRPFMPWWYWGVAFGLLLMVPLSTSRAGMAIALPALAAALLFTGALRLSRIRRSKRAAALAIGVGALAIIGVRAASGWMAVDEVDGLRTLIRSATIETGQAQSPLGSGLGSFVPVFQSSSPPSLWLAQYVNHAHNEYVQWWLEAGWVGMLVLASVLALLAACGWRILRLRLRGGNAILAATCFVCICVVLGHSWADYPLRTTTLMATTAALAGLMLAALADAASKDAGRRRIADGRPRPSKSDPARLTNGDMGKGDRPHDDADALHGQGAA